jgi:hypothetical protein
MTPVIHQVTLQPNDIKTIDGEFTLTTTQGITYLLKSSSIKKLLDNNEITLNEIGYQ